MDNKQGLGWINDKTLNRLSEQDKQDVFNYRRKTGNIKRLENTINKDKQEIERLTQEIKNRKEKIREHIKEQKEIYNRFVQYTEDWLPMFWVVLNVKKGLNFWNSSVKMYDKKSGKMWTKSMYLGTERNVVKELKLYYTDEETQKKLTGESNTNKKSVRNRRIIELLKDYITDYLFDNLRDEESIERFKEKTHNLITIRKHYKLDDIIEIELELE